MKTIHHTDHYQEKRDYSIGRVLAYQAMIESQFVFEAQDSGVLWKAMLQRMFSQAKSTPRLRDEYCSVINNCIPALAKQDQRTSFINDILSATVDHQLENTPEGVALWLTILANSSKVSYPEGCWRNQDPLDKHERPRLIRIVKGSTDYETSNTGGTQKPQPSGNQTRLSFAWNVLIFSYLDRLDPVSTRKNSKSKNKFGAFWKEMVDGGLISQLVFRSASLTGHRYFLRRECVSRTQKPWTTVANIFH